MVTAISSAMAKIAFLNSSNAIGSLISVMPAPPCYIAPPVDQPRGPGADTRSSDENAVAAIGLNRDSSDDHMRSPVA